MAQQSSNGNRPKLSEKGLLTPDNCVVALIDHQGQMLFGTSNFDRQGIINNTVAFGKAARVFDAAERVALTPPTETVRVHHSDLINPVDGVEPLQSQLAELKPLVPPHRTLLQLFRMPRCC